MRVAAESVEPRTAPADLVQPMIKLSPVPMHRGALVLFLLCIIPTLWFARRSYGSLELLRSAYEAGAPDTSSIRPWMTLTYVADAYHVSVSALQAGLSLPAAANPSMNLRAAARQAGVSPFQYVERVQRAVAALGSKASTASASESSGWLDALSDELLSALLVYGYPILALILVSGAVGLPLPDGIATAVAGSLAAQGRINWMAAGIVVVVASILGDVVGYAVGRLISQEFLHRHGRWLGYNPTRGASVEWLFEQWGLLTVFITRTFVSYLSSVASVLAGVSHYRLSKFVAASFAGRVVWTSAYLGLGYAIGADLDAATGFLGNLTGFLLSAIVLLVAALIATIT